MSLNTTPRTWVSGEVVTAAEMNTEIRDAITGMEAAWSTYTPTLVGVTLGNGTIAGRFNQVGKSIVGFSAKLTLGSTSAITGSITVSLPVNARDTNWISTDCSAFDSSAGAWWPMAAIATAAGTLTVRTFNTVAGGNLIVTSATVPFTWAVGDILYVTGQYETA